MLGIAPSSDTVMCTVTPRALSLLAPIRLVFYPSASLPPCPYLRFFTSVVGAEPVTPLQERLAQEADQEEADQEKGNLGWSREGGD
jgi:hypothetical protein